MHKSHTGKCKAGSLSIRYKPQGCMVILNWRLIEMITGLGHRKPYLSCGINFILDIIMTVRNSNPQNEPAKDDKSLSYEILTHNKVTVNKNIDAHQLIMNVAPLQKYSISDVERARQKKLLLESIERQAIFKKKVEKDRLLKDQKQRVEFKRIAEGFKQEMLEHKKYHIDFPDFDIFDVKKKSKLAKLLSQLRKKEISKDELKWLEGQGVTSGAIKKKNLLHIAQAHLSKWLNKNQPWELVNASATYRKLGMPNIIQPILGKSYPFKFSNNNDNLKSALLTTYGGVCRDVGNDKSSLRLGHEAHQVTPLNFRPCTLLGAVYISTGEFSLAHEWYEKAKERGFTQNSYDNDIRSIYLRSSQYMQKRLKQNLIQTGHKYSWL